MHTRFAAGAAIVALGLMLTPDEASAQQSSIPLSYTCEASPPAELAKGAYTFYPGSQRAPGAGTSPDFRIVWELSCTNRVPAGKVGITPRMNEQMAGLAEVVVTNIDQFTVFGKGTPELFLSAACQVVGHVKPTPCRLWLMLARRAADFDHIASFLVLGENGAVLAYGTGVAPVPKKVSSKSRILYDQRTTATTSRAVPDTQWSQLNSSLTAGGLAVAYHAHTNGRLTAAALQQSDLVVIRPHDYTYDAAEKQALLDFVNQGGAMMVAGEWGPSIPSAPTIDLLAHFGATYESNTIMDAAHSAGGYPSWVVYSAARNFIAHPINAGLAGLQSAAGSSLSGTQWQAILESDDDATPPRRPAVIVREMGSGRVFAVGDTNIWSNDDLYGPKISVADNRRFAIRSVNWLLSRPLDGL